LPGEQATITERIRVYFVLTKPNVWWLLVFVGVAGYLAGSAGMVDPATLVALLTALSAGSAGAETLANYLERDVDSRMRRTRNRPLPRGLINPPTKALLLGLTLVSASLVVTALYLNPMALVFMLIGILDYVVVYVVLTKKRTPLNILLGSAAGAAPVWVGYAASGGFDLTAVLLGLLVILWIPVHVWSLALRYREDYLAVGIPMLPTVVSKETSVRIIAVTTILLAAFALAIPLLDSRFFSPLYVATALASSVLLLALGIVVIVRSTGRNAWRLFKFTSPYLAVIFLAVMLESLL
jgi:protoheme IX farnesyltransferase